MPCLTTLFYNALSYRVKQELEEQVPLTTPTSYANNLTRLMIFISGAKKAETELQTIAAVASNAARRSSPAIRTLPQGSGPQAFTGGQTFICTNGRDGTVIPQYSLEAELRALYADNLVLLSAAEQAMRQANGLRAPMVCWGCAGLKRYEAKDQEDQKLNRYSNPSPSERNWSALGYSSKEQQETIIQIVDPSTSKYARRAMIAALLAQKPDEEQEESEQPKKFRIFFSYSMVDNTGGKEDGNQATAYNTFLAPQMARFQFPISYSLPFIDLPIGRDSSDDEQHIFLRGLADTGGCCSMAWKPYMLKLKEQFPEFVSEHTVLKERQFEDMEIGGIQGGVWITDVIVFYMPFATNGENHGIMFGLTDDLPINVLYGLPFMIQAQIIIDLDAQTATSKVLATTFKLKMLPPKARRPVYNRLQSTIAGHLSFKQAIRQHAGMTTSPFHISHLTLPQSSKSAHAPTQHSTPSNSHREEFHSFAASLATQAEEKAGKHLDGSTQVQVPKRVWRPQMKSAYVEQEFDLDPSSSLDWIYEGRGKAIAKEKQKLAPREDIIQFDELQHGEELAKELQLQDCLSTGHPVIKSIVQLYWDVFASEGLQNPIRGFQFSIDTGEREPVCCKPPRYGPHEARIIDKLSNQLDKMGITEDDFGPWRALCVLAAKPNQEHVHWSEYVFRLCVSYRKLNAVTRPFAFRITR